ncbi:MAG: methyltransferase domain-containing protein [Spirochaetia bacterium]|nr:methyltransferase domain-containing protein [Spirochaetia bacterium]
MNPNDSYKENRRRNFSRAASTYDATGEIQGRIGEILLGLVPKDIPGNFICDLGCGTGFHTRSLSELFPAAEIHAVDLSPGMIGEAKKRSYAGNVKFLATDMEGEAWRGAHYDLIFSNLAVQWALDPGRLLKNISHSLAPGAWLALSLFLQGTYGELRQIFLENGLAVSEPPTLLTGKNVGALLFEAGLRPMFQSEKKEIEWRRDLLSILRNVRDSGTAAGLGEKLLPKKMAVLEKAYRLKYEGAQGLPLTWQYGIYLCRKI